MIEILDVLSNSLSALVGGLSAILAGLVLHRHTVYQQNREHKVKLIEEIYRLTIETEEWAKQETIIMGQYIQHGSKIDLDNHKSKSKHIRMLLKLYFKSSNQVCDELDKYELLFFNGMQLAYNAPNEFKKPEQQDTIMEASKLYYLGLVKIRVYLEKEMQKLTKVS